MKRQQGLTAIELSVVVTILAILAALSGPSFVNLIRSNKVSNVVNTFMADMRFARSEAIRRGSTVVMCRSNAPEAASPTCGSGSNGWASGWLVFEDRDTSNTFNTGDQLLRIQAAFPSVDQAVEGGSSYLFQFAPTGRLRAKSGTTEVTIGSTSFGTWQKKVCVSLSGNMRVLKGSESCP